MSKFNKHIIVVGTARSGTSWLSETMAQKHRYRMLFEPEHQTRTKKGYLICDQWIDSKTKNQEGEYQAGVAWSSGFFVVRILPVGGR